MCWKRGKLFSTHSVCACAAVRDWLKLKRLLRHCVAPSHIPIIIIIIRPVPAPACYMLMAAVCLLALKTLSSSKTSMISMCSVLQRRAWKSFETSWIKMLPSREGENEMCLPPVVLVHFDVSCEWLAIVLHIFTRFPCRPWIQGWPWNGLAFLNTQSPQVVFRKWEGLEKLDFIQYQSNIRLKWI